MAVGGEGGLLFFFSFCFFLVLSLSQSLNGDWWRVLFSPPKPIAQTAVGGEGPFFLSFLFFCPCKPIAQVRLVVRGNLFPPYYSNYYFLSVHWLREKNKQKQHTSALCVYERVGGPSLGTQNAGVYLRGSY